MLETIALTGTAAAVVGRPIVNLFRQRPILQHAEEQIAELQQQVETMQSVIANLPPEQHIWRKSVPLQTPPPFATTWDYLRHHHSDDAGMFPLGWIFDKGTAGLICASVTPYSESWTGHMLLTGYTRFGKDTLAFGALWALCMRNNPRDLQLVYIDGKRSDGGLWAGLDLAHLHCEPCLGPEDVPDAMRMLRELREERERQRVAERVTEWKDLPDAIRPPQIVVYISELSLLEAGCSKADPLEKWLARELSSALASGITYIIGAQNVSNWATAWRDHCQTAIAGYRDKEREVAPNLGITPAEVEERGGISPHRFQGRGFFTLRNGQALATVRISNITLEERRNCIAQLPRRVGTPALLVETDPVSVTVTEAVVPVVQAAAPTPLVEAVPVATPVVQAVDPALAESAGQLARLLGFDVQAPHVQEDARPVSIPRLTAEHYGVALLLGLDAQNATPAVMRSQLAAARRLLHATAPHVPFTALLTLATTRGMTLWDALPLLASTPKPSPALPVVPIGATTPTRAAGRPWRDRAADQRGRRRTAARSIRSGSPAAVTVSARTVIDTKLASNQPLTESEIRQAVTAGWYTINQLAKRNVVRGTKSARRERLQAIVNGTA